MLNHSKTTLRISTRRTMLKHLPQEPTRAYLHFFYPSWSTSHRIWPHLGDQKVLLRYYTPLQSLHQYPSFKKSEEENCERHNVRNIIQTTNREFNFAEARSYGFYCAQYYVLKFLITLFKRRDWDFLVIQIHLQLC